MEQMGHVSHHLGSIFGSSELIIVCYIYIHVGYVNT